MTILVTGGGGFLGRHIVEALLARNEDVRVLARHRYPSLEALGAKCVEGDVKDPSAVTHALDGVTGVFHAAARVGYFGPFREFHATNVEGTRVLLEAARARRVERFVYTSSPSVVIDGEASIEGGDETLPYAKTSHYAYGTTKAEAEEVVLSANEGELRTCALRPHLIYGPKDPHIIPRLLARARAGRLVRVGDGTNRVDVTFIDNAVDAHLRAFDALSTESSSVAGRAYFIGDPEPVRLWDFVGTVLEGFGAPPVRRSIPVAAAWAIGFACEMTFRTLRLTSEPPMTRMAATMLGRSHWFSHRRATEDFGYRPVVSTSEGLARVFGGAGGG